MKETYPGELQDLMTDVARDMTVLTPKLGDNDPLVRRAQRALSTQDLHELREVQLYTLQEWPDTCGYTKPIDEGAS